jgi:hypothetical protein
MSNPKDLAFLVNKSKPLNLALFALFAIGVVVYCGDAFEYVHKDSDFVSIPTE